ncbi:hypothetical protein QJQ45_015496, partial [Haematococcus lacustris]
DEKGKHVPSGPRLFRVAQLAIAQWKRAHSGDSGVGQAGEPACLGARQHTPAPRTARRRRDQSPPRANSPTQRTTKQKSDGPQPYQGQELHEEEQQQENQHERQRQRDRGDWGQRKESMNERWRELNPSLRHSYIDAAPALQQSHVDQGKLVQQHAQMQLDRGWEGHACCRLGPVPSSAMLVPYAKGPLPAEYATTAIQQHLNSHLDSSGLEGEVQSRYKSGRLSLNHLIGDTGGQPDDDCATNLSCSRPEVSDRSGPVSVHGLVGFCCCHGVPSLGLFCNMPTPEQFAFYLLALTAIMAYSCKVDFYIDFGCRLKITWARYVDALGHPPSWKDVRIMVNWMHGASHNQRCQVQNNGRHQPGSGWRYGEQCEQLWSMLKDMAGITRYMTLAHRADIIQSTLSKIAFRKAVGLLDLLIKTWKEMKVKLVKVQSELVTLQLVAEQAGVTDGQQASEAYRASCLPSSPAEGPHDVWKGEYVLLLLQEQAWQAMNGQAVTLLVSLTPTVTQLLWATCKGWQLKTIQSKQLTMEVTHRVDAETGISQTDMQRGLELIRLGKIAGCQFKIESLVAEVMQLQTMKDRQGTSCNETKRMAKAQARKRAQAKEELLCMAEWQALGTSQQPAALRLPETVISRMVAGTAPPWVQDSSTSGAVTLHHGKRFFQLYSDQDRIREQQSILKLELNRLKAWLRHMLEECTASQPSLSEGQQFYVAQHMAWVANEMKRAAVLNWE